MLAIGELGKRKAELPKHKIKSRGNRSSKDIKLKKLLTERLFMRRCSTSSIESIVRSAMTFNGMVRSSEGRLQENKIEVTLIMISILNKK